MSNIIAAPDRAELTSIVAERARALSRLPLLLGAIDATVGLALARGWSTVWWFPGMCAFSGMLATSVWALTDRALEEWSGASNRALRACLRVARGAAAIAGVFAGFLMLFSVLLIAMGAYFR